MIGAKLHLITLAAEQNICVGGPVRSLLEYSRRMISESGTGMVVVVGAERRERVWKLF